jgi:hypothetical protein
MTETSGAATVTERPGAATAALTALVDRFGHQDDVRVGDLFARLGPTGLGLAVLVLALPALIPLPGPFGLLFGAGLAIVAVQMMAGLRRLWLPAVLADRRVPTHVLRRAVEHAVPWLARMERLTRRRRMRALTRGTARMLVGVPVLALAIALALPIPLGNLMPVLALVAIALAILEQDGVALMVALGLSLVALAWTGLLIVAGAGIVAGIASLVAAVLDWF